MVRTKVQVLIGDIFQSRAQTLINTVNCVGIMGKGVALQFKRRFPVMFEDYKLRCVRGLVKLGEPYIYKGLIQPWIINFPTKRHWNEPSDLSAIKRGLEYLHEHVLEWRVESLASPPLGCGLGQLDWRAVGPVLYQGLRKLDIPVVLFAPPETPRDQMTHDFLSGRKSYISPSQADEPINIGLVAVVEALDRISKSRVVSAGSIMFHKLVYFGTIRGLPTKLEFSRGVYGPYSEVLLKREIPKLIRHDLLQVRLRNDVKRHEAGLSYDFAHWKAELREYEPIISDLVDLFLRIKSTDQAELYSAVHFCAMELSSGGGDVSEADVLQEVTHWKRRREVQFTVEQIGDAIRTLKLLGWLDVALSDDLPLPVESRLEFIRM